MASDGFRMSQALFVIDSSVCIRRNPGAWPRFDIDGVSTLLRCYTEGFSPWVRVHHEVFWRASWRAPRRASWRAAVPQVTGTPKKQTWKVFITLWRTNVPPNIKRLNHVIILARAVPAEMFHINNHVTPLMPIIPYNLLARLGISDQNSTFLDPEMLNSNVESGARLPGGATSSLASAATVLSKFCLFYVFPPRASDSHRTLCQGFLSLHHPPWECEAVLEPCSASAVHPGKTSTENCSGSKVKFEDFYCIYYVHLSYW